MDGSSTVVFKKALSDHLAHEKLTHIVAEVEVSSIRRRSHKLAGALLSVVARY